MKVIVTGGAGFIGSSLIRHILNNSNASVVNIDKLTYAGNLESLEKIEKNKNYKFVKVDIIQQDKIYKIFQKEKPDLVMHLAAESHVDKSIDSPLSFLETNILGTFSLLEASRKYLNDIGLDKKKNFCFHHISTDEVFGSLGEKGFFNEDSQYSPNSPYSASKASADHLVRSWGSTYGIPYLITNCSNNYGPYQYPEKLIPTTIINALKGNDINIYGTGENVRDWLYVEDHVEALWELVNNCDRGQTFCIGGNNERSNLEVVQEICTIMNQIIDRDKSDFLKQIRMVQDRPGHDMRYAIDTKKIKSCLNWKPKETFTSGLEKTVSWYLENQDWCERVSVKHSTENRLGLKKN